jgi:hypothetical protein
MGPKFWENTLAGFCIDAGWSPAQEASGGAGGAIFARAFGKEVISANPPPDGMLDFDCNGAEY